VAGGEKRTPGENVFEERRAPRERVRNIWDRREKNERAFAPAPRAHLLSVGRVRDARLGVDQRLRQAPGAAAAVRDRPREREVMLRAVNRREAQAGVAVAFDDVVGAAVVDDARARRLSRRRRATARRPRTRPRGASRPSPRTSFEAPRV
jgi:hypothetical protein